MRVLLVGGVRQRLHEGPVEWAGHQFELTPHRFDRLFEESEDEPERPLRVDREAVERFVDEAQGYDAIFCEAPEAFLLAHEWQRAGRSPRPLVALEVQGLRRVRLLGKWYESEQGKDPWTSINHLPWIQWIAASDKQHARLLDAYVPKGHIHRINGSTGGFSLFIPDAEALLDGGLAADAALADGLPTGGVVAAGTGRRDLDTVYGASAELPEIPLYIIDDEWETRRRRLEERGIAEPPQTTWVRPQPLERFIAFIRRARMVVVALKSGGGDAGHTTVSTAHRLGVPVICSNVPGIINYVEDDVTAILVPDGDPKALARAIGELWERPERGKQLVLAGKKVEAERARACQQGLLEALEAACRGVPDSDG